MGQLIVMTSESAESSPQNTASLPVPPGDDVIAPRPAGVTVIAYFILFNIGGAAFNALVFGRYLQQAPILPHAPVSNQLQWQLFEAWNYVNFFVAIGLLWGQRWARWGYLIGGVIGFPFILMYPEAQTTTLVQLFFSLPCFLVCIYLLYRKDARLYFAPTTLKPPRTPFRRRLGACLYVLATVFVFWSLNAIVLGITQIYPQTLHRDKLAFLALPIILIAEWIGKTPGVISRLSILACAFSVYLMQMFLYKYFSPYTLQVGPSLWQLRNWAIGISIAAIILVYLQWRGRRQQ